MVIGTGSGCTTLYSQQQAQEDARTRMQIRYINDNLERMEGRIEALEIRMDDRAGELRALREEIDHQSEAAREAQDGLRAAIAAEQAARESDKSQIITTISTKVAELVKESRPSVSGISGQGYEHVVQRGETISEIAKAYNVTIPVIVEANQLRNANAIRVGQKLFIPR